ncbi:sugar ABC transporter substrate-binding protein [Lachnospiraceae bacterium OttesenSCG-928-D06]|nr:sugar ABC transporter substrate-binding protein [Lachnospiraceae bacterium OttesenSCG-928-D06]
MKKITSKFLASLLGLSIVLTGCGNTETVSDAQKQNNTSKETEEVGTSVSSSVEKDSEVSGTVVFAYWGDEKENNAIKNVIASFEDAHPEIKVDAQWIQQDYLTKVQIQIAGDTTADVYLMSASDLPGFADNYITQEADVTNFLNQDVIDSLTINGEIKSKPFIIKPKVMAINKDLFTANGIEIPSLTEPMTPEEFEEIAMKIVDQTQEPQIFGSEPLWMGNWIYSFGGSYYTEDGNASNLASKEVITAADFIVQSKELGYVPDDTQKQGQSMMDWFLSGRIGMYTDFGPWSIPQMSDVKGFDWDLVPMPGNGGGKEINGLSISAKSNNIEAAQIFVDYLCENETAQQIIGGDKSAYGVPVNPNVVQKFENIMPGKNLSAFVYAAYNQTPSETQKKTNEINSVLKKIDDETKIGTGTEMPADVFPAIAEEITKIIQE